MRNPDAQLHAEAIGAHLPFYGNLLESFQAAKSWLAGSTLTEYGADTIADFCVVKKAAVSPLGIACPQRGNVLPIAG